MFHVVHAKYGRLIGRVYDGFFSLTLPTYKDVLHLEEQVRKFELDIPASLRYQTTSDDRLRPYLGFQVSLATLSEEIHDRLIITQNKMLTLELVCMRAYIRHMHKVCLFPKQECQILNTARPLTSSVATEAGNP